MKRLISICIAIALFFSPELFSKENRPQKDKKINLKEIINLAQQNDNILKKLKYDQKAFNAQYEESIKAFFPKLNTELKRSHAVTFNNPRGTTIFTFDSSMELPIYDRTIIHNRRKAKAESYLNKIKIGKRLNDLSKEIVTLYYSILNLKALVEIRKEEYIKAKEFYKLTKKKLDLQKVLALDLLLSEGAVLTNRNNWISAHYDYQEEILKLIHKLNLDENIILNDIENTSTYLKSLELNIKIGLNQRGDIKEKLFDSKVKEELYEIEKSVFYPKVSLFSDLQLTGEDEFGFKDRTDWSVFVTLSLALLDDVNLSGSSGYNKDFRLDEPKDMESVKLSFFDGTSNKFKRFSAQSNYRSVYDELKDLKHKIKEEITISYHNIIEAQNAIQLAKLNKKIGIGLVKKAEAEYSIGKKGMEDIIEAKEKEILYRIEYHRAILKYRLEVLNLKWATGVLWKDFY